MSKKQADLHEKILRDLLKLPENKKCFDCPLRSPVFVNLNTQTFTCARCSGLVRELNHRVKSVSASLFTPVEIAILQTGGNGVAAQIWLARYHASGPEPESEYEIRQFMKLKYVERRWVDAELMQAREDVLRRIMQGESIENISPLKPRGETTQKQPAQPTSPLSSPNPSHTLPYTSQIPQTSSINNINLLGDDDTIIKPRSDAQTRTADLLSELEQRQSPPSLSNKSPVQSQQSIIHPGINAVSTAPKQIPRPLNLNEADLTGFEPPQMQQKSPPGYVGGMLSPTGGISNQSNPVNTAPRATMTVLSPTSSGFKSPLSAPLVQQTDPYQALRALSESSTSKQPGRPDSRRQSMPIPGQTSTTAASFYGFQQQQSQGFGGSFNQTQAAYRGPSGIGGINTVYQSQPMFQTTQDFGSFQQAAPPTQTPLSSWTQQQPNSSSAFDELDPLGKSRSRSVSGSNGF